MKVIKEIQTTENWVQFNINNEVYTIDKQDINDFLNDILKTEDVKLQLLNGTENILYSDNFKHRLTKEEKEVFRYKPLSHQVAAFNFMFKHKKILLLDSMGLGR